MNTFITLGHDPYVMIYAKCDTEVTCSFELTQDSFELAGGSTVGS